MDVPRFGAWPLQTGVTNPPCDATRYRFDFRFAIVSARNSHGYQVTTIGGRIRFEVVRCDLQIDVNFVSQRRGHGALSRIKRSDWSACAVRIMLMFGPGAFAGNPGGACSPIIG
jgi:hypothetical protein